MAKAATLQAQRRELIAAYARARGKHDKSAGLGRRLATITTNLLRAEIRAAKDAGKARPHEPDLFSQRAA
ncbi:hypothetical protein V5F77_20270 [Xanthobacter sp. DSM 24535]|uniref:hypothetical protein n=1 Tax=Roseixanthobacter psychrophilus TaxID=3119917 RepID=UPI00372AC18A